MKRKISSLHSTDTHISPQSQHVTSGSKNKVVPLAAGEESRPVEITASGPVQGWLRFWFTPVVPVGMHVVRVLAGLLFIGWLLAFAGYQEGLFSLQGWFDAQAYKEAARIPGGPPAPFNWSILYLCGTNAALFHGVYWASIGILFLFTLGLATRITSVLTWIIVVSFVANPAISYGGDYLLVILAFYLMIGYVLYRQWSGQPSLACRILGPADAFLFSFAFTTPGEKDKPHTSHAANLALRLLQVHFAIILVTSALHKLQYGDWWAGVALWYPLHPPFETTFQSIRTGYQEAQSQLFAMSLVQYAVLAWQLCFPLFAWRKGWWRLVLLGGALLGWIGMVFVFRLPLFGPIFAIGALSFLTAEEWQRFFHGVGNRTKFLSGWIPSGAVASVNKSAKVGT